LNKTPEQIEKLIEYVTQKVGQVAISASREIGVINYFNEHISEIANVSDILKPEELINLNFLGINLGLVPKISTDLLFGLQSSIYLPLLIIPILAVATTYISSKIMAPKTDSGNKGGSSTANSTQNMMLLLGPVMTLIFSFQLPAGVVLYWIASNVFQILQQLYINKYVMRKKEVKAK